MASQPPANNMPVFYNNLVPLSSQLHPRHGIAQREGFDFAKPVNAIPVTVDEFALVQRHYPLVFGMGEGAAPLALVGLANGDNLFIDEQGQWKPETYVPAYVRRYPFMLAKLMPESENLSLVFDDTTPQIAEGIGEPLFEGEEPTEMTRNILAFCEQFEQAIDRTRAFMDEIIKLDLLMDGEVSIQPPGDVPPVVYRGFRMVNEDKLRELRGDQARKLVQNGIMGLLYAHLMSLSHIADLYGKANPQLINPDAPAA